MIDKTADDFAPAKPPGHAPLHASHAVSADHGRSANRIIVRLGISGGLARTPAQAVVSGGEQGVGRPKPLCV